MFRPLTLRAIPPPCRPAPHVAGSGTCRRGRRCGLLILLLFAAPSGVAAQDRLVRTFGGESGLLPPAVALAQDSAGFIWAGTRAGLFRYDGSRFERWAIDVLPRAVGTIVVSPEGAVTVVDADGRIVELTRDGARQGAVVRVVRPTTRRSLHTMRQVACG